MTCALCPEYYECQIRGTQQEGSCQFYNQLRVERDARRRRMSKRNKYIVKGHTFYLTDEELDEYTAKYNPAFYEFMQYELSHFMSIQISNGLQI